MNAGENLAMVWGQGYTNANFKTDLVD